MAGRADWDGDDYDYPPYDRRKGDYGGKDDDDYRDDDDYDERGYKYDRRTKEVGSTGMEMGTFAMQPPRARSPPGRDISSPPSSSC